MQGTHETRNLILQYYNAFNQQDMPAFFELLDDDIIHDINQGHREVGKQKFALFMQKMNRCYKEQIKSLVIMINESGTHAAAEFIVDGEYIATDEGLPPASGQKYSLPAGSFFEIQAGKVKRVTTYYNLQDWINQVCKNED